MGIEPIGSAMAYQAQQTQQTSTQQSTSSQPEKLEIESAPIVDNQTAAVAKANENNANNNERNSDTQTNNEQIRKAVEEMNRKMGNTEAQFGIHEATNRVTIKIVDKESKKVIREFPAEKTLDMIAKAWELAGLLVDEKR